MDDLTQATQRKIINFDIESLRGFASIFVVWFHAIDYKYFTDPKFMPSGVLSYLAPGHFCVLIFFMLSGYVIGISTKKPMTWRTSKLYLKKRFVRLYPIYLITLVFTLLTSIKVYSVNIVFGNIMLLQGAFFNDNVNGPAWSLHYEALYYLLFIIISIFRFNPFLIALISLVVGLTNFILYPTIQTPMLTSYSLGLIFWILGLGISKILASSETNKSSYQILLSCILFVLCIDKFNLFDTAMHKTVKYMGVNVVFPKDIFWNKIAINLFDMSYLPFSFLIILIFTGKNIPYKLLMLRMLFIFSSLNILYVANHAYIGDLNYADYTLPTIFLVASLVCLFFPSIALEKIGQRVGKAGIWLGSLSYGIYLVHFPLLLLFSRITVFSGTWLTFAVRFVLLMLLTVGLGYWLEKVVQPRVKAFFFRDAPVLVPEPGQHSTLLH